MKTLSKFCLHVLTLILGIAATGLPAGAEPLRFHVTIDPAFHKSEYTGRVYVVISSDLEKEPRHSMGDWFNPPQIIARDITNNIPGEAIVLGDTPLAYPGALRDLKSGDYSIQAVARRSLDSARAGRGPGDLYSEPRVVTIDPKSSGPLILTLNRVVPSRGFTETDRLKLVEIRSTSLSEFSGREVNIRAGVVLPKGWKPDSQKRYPVLYMIPGFGGDHRMARFFVRSGVGQIFSNLLMVIPDPTCYRGHSVFADSQNNGPWGAALVHELIPEVERRFRGAQSGDHRYVMGVSSGGWSSLWMQVTYPDAFNGCWAHCPDSVDFRDFQQINLYDPGVNMYTDGQGNRRPLARRDGKVVLWYDDFVHLEDVLGPGGQIHSFEAVFSRRLGHGLPEPLFNRKTGEVFTQTAKSWRAFDIRLILERNWASLAPKLMGKLHVYGGESDMFYLEGSVRLLKESLAKLGSDADVKIIEGMGHGMYRESIQPMVKTIEDNFQQAFETQKRSGAASGD